MVVDSDVRSDHHLAHEVLAVRDIEHCLHLVTHLACREVVELGLVTVEVVHNLELFLKIRHWESL